MQEEEFKETLNTSSQLEDSSDIKVCIRIRPLNREESTAEANAWIWDQNTISFSRSNTSILRKSSIIGVSGRTVEDQSILIPQQSFTFDSIFKPDQTNNHIFNSVISNICEKSIQGYHGSVFTYGQTSSGKTFTMNGTLSQPGIIPQAINYCFELIQKYANREFLFRVSYLEIYNEQVKDLLTTEPTQIKIQHGAKVGTILTGVKEPVVLNPQQVLALLKAGEAHRHVGSTDMNEKSSRAHTLFKLIIESKERVFSPSTPDGKVSTGSSSGAVRTSTLSLVDLAGSENAKMTNTFGDRAIEAKFINMSLLTLSTIIQRLGDDRSPTTSGRDKWQHLPYRDSKLTRLMQAALSGNAKIAIICTMSSSLRCLEESVNTLKFASRAKRVKMEAIVNEVSDDKTLLKAYRIEIESLRARLQSLENGHNHGGRGPQQQTAGGQQDHEDDTEENQDFILQMIEKMERLILKADTPFAPSPEPSPRTTRPPPDRPKSPRPEPPSPAPKIAPKPSGLKAPSRTAPAKPAEKSGSAADGPDKEKPNSTSRFGFKPKPGGSSTKDLLPPPSPAVSAPPPPEVPSQSPAEDGQQVLGTVSAMLQMLKMHMRGGKVRNNSFREEPVQRPPRKLLRIITEPNGNGHGGHERDDETRVLTALLAELRSELRAKEEESQLLQDELDKKNQMLCLLTEGLREVEVNQVQWLAENELLSGELDNLLEENNGVLRPEIVRLQALLTAAGIDYAVPVEGPRPATSDSMDLSSRRGSRKIDLK